MKMIIAILHKEDEIDTVEELNKENFFVTKLATTGGFLKSKNPYCTVYILWDKRGLLSKKDSPLDKGKDVLEELMKEKIEVDTDFDNNAI